MSSAVIKYKSVPISRRYSSDLRGFVEHGGHVPDARDVPA